MKFTKLFAAAALMASAAAAGAADLEHTVTINLGGASAFEDSFNSPALKGLSFLDTYNFSVTNSSNFTGGLFSFANGKQTDLNVTTFSLYSGNTLVAKGNQASSGVLDLWSLNKNKLAIGNYSLKIGGLIVGTQGGSYRAGVSVSPVPEPDTWAMVATSMAALGFLARRRKSKGVQAVAAA